MLMLIGGVVSRSSLEVEYRALALLTTQLLWLKQLLRAIHVDIPTCKVFCDSKPSIQLASNPILNERSKHIDIDVHFICEHSNKFINLLHVNTKHQLAGPFTKVLPKPLFVNLISKLGIFNLYIPTWGGVLELVPSSNLLQTLHTKSIYLIVDNFVRQLFLVSCI